MTPPMNLELCRALPIHDAELISIEVVPVPNGAIKLCLSFKLHPDESLDEVSKLGISSRSLRLTYGNCWQIASNIFGTCSKPQTIDGWDIVGESELLKRLRSQGLASSAALQHHRIELSDGSRLDVLTEGPVSIEEFASPS